MTHLSRLAAPKTWSIKRKSIKWITKPTPGPHNLESSISLSILLKEILKHAKTNKEVKKILNINHILINQIRRINPRFPIGIMDTIEIKETGEYYRLIYNKKGKLYLQKIDKQEADKNILKIINKKIIKGNKIQLNFHNGTNILVNKNDYKTNDSIIISNKEIKDHLKLEKNALIFVIGGKYIGNIGVLQEIHESENFKQAKLIIKINKENIEIFKKYAFVVPLTFKK